jgi:uracil-DNA glycosylase
MNDVVPMIRSLAQLRAAEAECTRCPLYKFATHGVPGEGPARAHVLVVGEQPGDKEDVAGKPFVGPAGRVLNEALEEAGIDRRDVFVTNAVKHFKFEQRGKRRLHKKPNAYEIERCKIWLDTERRLVKPAVVIALGATAARSLMGRPVAINQVRGEPIELDHNARLVVTIHPSYLLRIREEADKRTEYARFIKDLRAASALLTNERPQLRAGTGR